METHLPNPYFLTPRETEEDRAKRYAKELLQALESAQQDLDATYKAIMADGGPEISVGQFGRLKATQALLAKIKD